MVNGWKNSASIENIETQATMNKETHFDEQNKALHSSTMSPIFLESTLEDPHYYLVDLEESLENIKGKLRQLVQKSQVTLACIQKDIRNSLVKKTNNTKARIFNRLELD